MNKHIYRFPVATLLFLSLLVCLVSLANAAEFGRDKFYVGINNVPPEPVTDFDYIPGTMDTNLVGDSVFKDPPVRWNIIITAPVGRYVVILPSFSLLKPLRSPAVIFMSIMKFFRIPSVSSPLATTVCYSH